jgi:enediyne biosynthesis protein E4
MKKKPGTTRPVCVRNACICICILGLFFACNGNNADKGQEAIFTVLENDATGLNFTNTLKPTNNFNVFHYMYYYNGAGIGAGDFNNDGLTDLFFAANQGNNKIYLNEGNLHFKDVTTAAKIPNDGGWSTGISVVDINNDGLLDIYICRVGKYEILNSHNQFLICKGIDKTGVPYYTDEAKAYGLDFSGFSTQAAFLDYDMDGDLDMYLLNHSLHQNGTYGPRKDMLAKSSEVSGDRLYRNDGEHFTDVTKQAGIHSSVLGYGLAVAVADINLDGYPDIYTGNDFHENDYLYINQRNGTFKDMLDTAIMHSSQYTMGTDVADVTNDGYPEIITTDMLPYDPTILKRSEGADQYDVQNIKLQYGYDHQFSQNSLQYNRGDGHFSETGYYSGVAATDWSWASLWLDFDNDGLKDLFISNGIPKRLNDIDYINYVSNDELQVKIRMNTVGEKDMALIDKFPQIKIPNKFYKNNGQLQFTDMAAAISHEQSTYSNGAVYADLDNDGDIDIVVNNIDEPVLLYENKANDKKDKPCIELKLKGDAKNINATGSKIIAFAGDGIRTYEKTAVHGFLSSMEIPVYIAVGNTTIDSLYLVWPDNSFEKINWQNDTAKLVSITYKTGLQPFDYTLFQRHNKPQTKPVKDITQQVNLLYKHAENSFSEFDREPLVPHMLSTEGPALAVADINGDGLEDVFTGASKRNKPAVFIQTSTGRFEKMQQPALDADSVFEDVDACWVDVNNDKATDLVVASGGNEYYGKDIHLLPRVYLNDGKGNLARLQDAFSNIYLTASTVSACDFNSDGFMDLFIGARTVPMHYGEMPTSYLLQNDGAGRFKDVTATYAKDLAHAGLVTQGLWYDIDKDGDNDLIVTLEWDGICAFINDKGYLTKKYLTNKKGWWNFVLPFDADNDGDIDLIAGNLGLNSRLKASQKEPVQLYYNDFDNNGTKEHVLTFYLQGRQIPFATKDELQKKMPELKKQFLYAADFAKAPLQEIFSKEKLSSSIVLTADYFSNAILINQGNLNYTLQPMPWQAQLTSYRDAAVTDANNDNLPDILLMGNYYETNIQMGRYDADYGTILLNKGKAQFTAQTLNGVAVKGQVRYIKKINIGSKEAYVLARNNDSTMVISY